MLEWLRARDSRFEHNVYAKTSSNPVSAAIAMVCSKGASMTSVRAQRNGNGASHESKTSERARGRYESQALNMSEVGGPLTQMWRGWLRARAANVAATCSLPSMRIICAHRFCALKRTTRRC
jgi:hypothetical protein